MGKELTPMDRTVGARMRQRRLALGLSQEKLAAALGLTFQQVQKYEKGANKISASRLFELSRILNAPIEFFYREAVSPSLTAEAPAMASFAEDSGPGYLADAAQADDGLALQRAFVRIGDSKVRRRIVDLVESLAAESAPPPAQAIAPSARMKADKPSSVNPSASKAGRKSGSAISAKAGAESAAHASPKTMAEDKG